MDIIYIPIRNMTHNVYFCEGMRVYACLETCLLAYTKPRIDLVKDNISESLWTEMMPEVIKQVTDKN